MPQISPIQPFDFTAVSEVPAPPVDDERRETGFPFVSVAEQDARYAVLSDEGDDIFRNYDIAVFEKEKQHNTPTYIL
jgi:hypothetical protein